MALIHTNYRTVVAGFVGGSIFYSSCQWLCGLTSAPNDARTIVFECATGDLLWSNAHLHLLAGTSTAARVSASTSIDLLIAGRCHLSCANEYITELSLGIAMSHISLKTSLPSLTGLLIDFSYLCTFAFLVDLVHPQRSVLLTAKVNVSLRAGARVPSAVYVPVRFILVSFFVLFRRLDALHLKCFTFNWQSTVSVHSSDFDTRIQLLCSLLRFTVCSGAYALRLIDRLTWLILDLSFSPSLIFSSFAHFVCPIN